MADAPAAQPPAPQPNRPREEPRDRRRDDRGQRPRGPRENRPPRDPNTVLIGNKPPMNYILAVVSQFNSGSAEVIIRARGKAISQAVDVAEIVRNKFVQKATVNKVAIGTEQVVDEDGRKRLVSAIEIRLGNPEVGAAKPPLPGQAAPQKPPVEPAPAQKSGGV